jgi:hypothetical protein
VRAWTDRKEKTDRKEREGIAVAVILVPEGRMERAREKKKERAHMDGREGKDGREG